MKVEFYTALSKAEKAKLVAYLENCEENYYAALLPFMSDDKLLAIMIKKTNAQIICKKSNCIWCSMIHKYRKWYGD